MAQIDARIPMAIQGPRIGNAITQALANNNSRDANIRANNADVRAEKQLVLNQNADKRSGRRLDSNIDLANQQNDRANKKFSGDELTKEHLAQIEAADRISGSMQTAYQVAKNNKSDEATASQKAMEVGYSHFVEEAKYHNSRFPDGEQIPTDRAFFDSTVAPALGQWHQIKMSEVQKAQAKQNIKTSGTNATNKYLYGLKTNLEKLKGKNKESHSAVDKNGRSTKIGKSDIEILNPGANGGTIRVPYDKLHSMWKQETDRAIKQNNGNDTNKISNKKRENVISFDDYILKLQGKQPKVKKGLSRSEQAMKEQGLMTASQISSQGN